MESHYKLSSLGLQIAILQKLLAMNFGKSFWNGGPI